MFYFSFHLPDDTVTSPRSSGQTSREAAETWVIEWVRRPSFWKAASHRNEGEIPIQAATIGNVRNAARLTY
jgi:hypothetical protein